MRLNPFHTLWRSMSLAVLLRVPARASSSHLAAIPAHEVASTHHLACYREDWIELVQGRNVSGPRLISQAEVVSMGRADSGHLPLGRGCFHFQAAYVSIEDEALIKQCLYFLCIFLCSQKSANVFSCQVQRRDCPGKTAAPLEGQPGHETLPPSPLSAKLRTGLPEPGQALWLRWFLIKAISIQRMCTQAQPKSMKSKEETEMKM